MICLLDGIAACLSKPAAMLQKKQDIAIRMIKGSSCPSGHLD